MVGDQPVPFQNVPLSLCVLPIDPYKVHEIFGENVAARIAHAVEDIWNEVGEWIVVLSETGEPPETAESVGAQTSVRVQYVKAREGELRKGKPRVFWVQPKPVAEGSRGSGVTCG